jgi:membrane-associated phospholipid phosphatase
MNRRRALNTASALTAPALLTAGCAFGFALVYVLTVRTTPGRLVSDASLRGALFTHSGLADGVDTVLAAVSLATLFAGIAAITLIALVRLRRVPGAVAVALVVAANLSTWLLKTRLLSRPSFGLSEIAPATHNSLPSGHTTAVFSAVVALLIVVPPPARRFVAVVGGTGAVVVALATMSAGWHRAGDSIAAVLVVGTWAGLAAIVTVLFAGAAPSRSFSVRAGGRPRRRLLALTAGVAGVGFALAFGLALIAPLRTSTVGDVAAFVCGGMLIIATAITVLMAELAVLEGMDPASRAQPVV